MRPMALDYLPPETTVIGTIEISVYMNAEGMQVAYGTDSLTKDAAIGYMTAVLDRMREERKYEWSTCPECRQPWSAHFEDPEDED